MRLMQDEQPIEHHVIRWCSSSLHNHGAGQKRKLLGGVTFDGGAGLENNKSKHTTTQAGVQEAQPSFGLPFELNGQHETDRFGVTMGGIKAGGGVGADIAGENNRIGHKASENEASVRKKPDKAPDENQAAESFWNNIITDVINSLKAVEYNAENGLNGIASDSKSDTQSSIKRRYLSETKALMYKLGKGIQSKFLKSRQERGGQNPKKRKSVLTSGTRPVSKEDIYEIQLNSSYLLESYNKNGERSTLGK